MVLRKNKPNDKEIEVKVDEIEIKQTCSMKLLGVSVELNFTEHIRNACTKASQLKVGVIFKFHNFIPAEVKLILYKTAILPYPTYCFIVWHFCKVSDKCKHESSLERALREIFVAIVVPMMKYYDMQRYKHSIIENYKISPS